MFQLFDLFLELGHILLIIDKFVNGVVVLLDFDYEFVLVVEQELDDTFESLMRNHHAESLL